MKLNGSAMVSVAGHWWMDKRKEDKIMKRGLAWGLVVCLVIGLGACGGGK